MRDFLPAAVMMLLLHWLLHPPARYLVIGYGVIRMKRGAKVEKKESPTLLLAHRIRLD